MAAGGGVTGLALPVPDGLVVVGAGTGLPLGVSWWNSTGFEGVVLLEGGVVAVASVAGGGVAVVDVGCGVGVVVGTVDVGVVAGGYGVDVVGWVVGVVVAAYCCCAAFCCCSTLSWAFFRAAASRMSLAAQFPKTHIDAIRPRAPNMRTRTFMRHISAPGGISRPDLPKWRGIARFPAMNSRPNHHAIRSLLLMLVMFALLGLALGACTDDEGGGGGDDADKSVAATRDTEGSDVDAADEGEASGGGGESADAPDCQGEPDRGSPTGPKKWDAPPKYTLRAGAKYTATLTTSEGVMVAELDPEEGPCAVNNFVFLAREGFYKDIAFHRVIKDFMVQTGDPIGTGSGGPGYSIKDDKVSKSYERGTLAMANAGPNTGGSQFFIVHNDYALPPSYSIFGKVTKGLEVLDKIATSPVAMSDSGEQSKPTKKLTLKSVTIAEA